MKTQHKNTKEIREIHNQIIQHVSFVIMIFPVWNSESQS